MENEKAFRRRLATAQNLAVSQRNYRRARDRALVRLANDYKEIYLDYLAEEKAKDEQEGKRWNFITDNLPSDRLVSTNQTEHTDRGDTSDIPQDKGNNE